MLTSGQQERKSKQRKIRNSEYYDMEGTFDRLYAESKKDKTFNHLMEIIESEENIKLAYRTIKKNTVILSILVYTFFSRMFDLMLPPVAKHSIVVA